MFQVVRIIVHVAVYVNPGEVLHRKGIQRRKPGSGSSNGEIYKFSEKEEQSFFSFSVGIPRGNTRWKTKAER
jgi:hypothetical protein